MITSTLKHTYNNNVYNIFKLRIKKIYLHEFPKMVFSWPTNKQTTQMVLVELMHNICFHHPKNGK
jgi:hypothetical protein